MCHFGIPINQFVGAAGGQSVKFRAEAQRFATRVCTLNDATSDKGDDLQAPGNTSSGSAKIHIIVSIALWLYTAAVMDGSAAHIPVNVQSVKAVHPYPVRIDLLPYDQVVNCHQAPDCKPAHASSMADNPSTLDEESDGGLTIAGTGSELPLAAQSAEDRSAPSPQVTPPDRLGFEPGLLGLRFSIAPEDRARGAIRTKKRFQINGGAAKSLPITVADDGSIEVDAKDILRELDGAASARTLDNLSVASKTGDSISFDQLRSAGLDVRYDAVLDKITVNAPKP